MFDDRGGGWASEGEAKGEEGRTSGAKPLIADNKGPEGNEPAHEAGEAVATVTGVVGGLAGVDESRAEVGEGAGGGAEEASRDS